MPKATELTDDQIRDILEQASSPDWNIPFFMGLPCSLTSVTKVSLETGLIFIGGDESIGVKHILNRHQGNVKHYSKEYFPTEFNFPIAPVTYYELADKIFKNGECIDSQYHHTYEANLDVAGSQHSIYRLVLYKDTKIVKTMYPVAALDKRPKYEIGFAGTYTHNVMQGIHKIEYKFYDSEKRAKFLLNVSYNEQTNKEHRAIYILKKDGIKHNVIYEKEFSTNINFRYFSLFYSTFKFPEEEKFVNDYSYENKLK